MALRRRVNRVVGDLAQAFSFQLVHAHRVFPTGYVALDIARRHKVPLVVSALGSDVHTHPQRDARIRRLSAKTIRGCDAVLPVSQALGHQLRSIAEPPSLTRVVYLGVDTEQFAPVRGQGELRRRLGLPVTGVGISSVCRLVKEKGIFELLEAFHQCADRFPSTWLVIVGDGPARSSFASDVSRRGLEDRVFLVGARPHAEVPSWIGATDVATLASHDEGLPNVVLEAMACAKPVVATNVGGVGEAVQDGVSGLVVPPLSVPPLAEALQRLLDSPSLRLRMGDAGREAACSRFPWTHTASQLHGVYEEAVQASREPPFPRRAP